LSSHIATFRPCARAGLGFLKILESVPEIQGFFARLGSFLHHHGAALTEYLRGLKILPYQGLHVEGAPQAVSRTALSINSGAKYIVTDSPRTQVFLETAVVPE
jgi:hypothetical protein